MTDTLDNLKTELRQTMREKLKSAADEPRREASMKACMRLAELEAFDRASVIMLYMPLPDELDLTPAAIRCFQMGKNVCVPLVDWGRKDMVPVETTSFDDEQMELDERGLRRPREGRPIPMSVIDLIVVPGLAFDTHGHRLGRGSGFYDRFLSRLSHRTIRVGICFDQQIIESVPVNELDAPLDLVVTDRRVAKGDPRPRLRPKRR